jgi:hypothetical protein
MAENSISSLFYLGISLFILPVALSFLKVTVSSKFYTFGIIVIILGAFHTMLLRRQK